MCFVGFFCRSSEACACYCWNFGGDSLACAHISINIEKRFVVSEFLAINLVTCMLFMLFLCSSNGCKMILIESNADWLGFEEVV